MGQAARVGRGGAAGRIGGVQVVAAETCRHGVVHGGRVQVQVWPAWDPRRILVTWSGHFDLEMNVLYRSFSRLFAVPMC